MRLGNVIRRWRTMEEKGIREVAKEIGTSHATLSRIERGEQCDSDTLALVLLWLIGKQ
jgi:transcriptional regulator with XRE-family HTH domain